MKDVDKGATFNEQTYVLALWYIEMPDNMGNVLFQVWREGDKWHCMMRTRIYEDDDLTVESKDRKRFYEKTIDAKCPEQYIFDDVNLQAAAIAAAYGTTFSRLIIKGNWEKFSQIVKDPKRRPDWLHFEELEAN